MDRRTLKRKGLVKSKAQSKKNEKQIVVNPAGVAVTHFMRVVKPNFDLTRLRDQVKRLKERRSKYDFLTKKEEERVASLQKTRQALIRKRTRLFRVEEKAILAIQRKIDEIDKQVKGISSKAGRRITKRIDQACSKLAIIETSQKHSKSYPLLDTEVFSWRSRGYPSLAIFALNDPLFGLERDGKYYVKYFPATLPLELKALLFEDGSVKRMRMEFGSVISEEARKKIEGAQKDFDLSRIFIITKNTWINEGCPSAIIIGWDNGPWVITTSNLVPCDRHTK